MKDSTKSLFVRPFVFQEAMTISSLVPTVVLLLSARQRVSGRISWKESPWLFLQALISVAMGAAVKVPLPSPGT